MSTTSCGINENGTLTKDRSKVGHIGDIIAFYGSTAPEGTLVCNGAAISRTTYSELFGVIGTTAGAGDGSTTFNLPDLRGLFLRGLNGTNAAALGVQQGDAIRNCEGIVHNVIALALENSVAPEGVFKNTAYGVHAYTNNGNEPRQLTTIYFNLNGVTPVANENRPVNTAVLYCMIYE